MQFITLETSRGDTLHLHALYSNISYVGIVGGKDDSENILVINCSSRANNVVITTGGFVFVVRPNCY